MDSDSVCIFVNCVNLATHVITYCDNDRKCLCIHHREFITILRNMYHDPKIAVEEQIEIRRIILFLLKSDYTNKHCYPAKVDICIYCHVIDYKSFIIDEMNVVSDNM